MFGDPPIPHTTSPAITIDQFRITKGTDVANHWMSEFCRSSEDSWQQGQQFFEQVESLISVIMTTF